MSPSTDVRKTGTGAGPDRAELDVVHQPSDFATSAQLSLRTRSANRFDSSPSSASERCDRAWRTDQPEHVIA